MPARSHQVYSAGSGTGQRAAPPSPAIAVPSRIAERAPVLAPPSTAPLRWRRGCRPPTHVAGAGPSLQGPGIALHATLRIQSPHWPGSLRNQSPHWPGARARSLCVHSKGITNLQEAKHRTTGILIGPSLSTGHQGPPNDPALCCTQPCGSSPHTGQGACESSHHTGQERVQGHCVLTATA